MSPSPLAKRLGGEIMSECYLVYYKDNFGNYECEYFGPERREDAIKYYKQRKVLISQELKDWGEEEGIYRCVWRKDTEFRELYFKVKEV